MRSMPMDGQLANAWQAAAHPDSGWYYDAVLTLIDHADLLPGAVFVNKRCVEMNDSDWRVVCTNSVPWCRCGERRLIVPDRGRSHFFPDVPAQTIVVDKNNPLILAPWGGDKSSAYIKFSVKGNMLVSEVNPYCPESQYPFGSLMAPRNTGRPGKTWTLLMELDKWVQRDGEVISLVPVGDVRLPVAAMTEVMDDKLAVQFEIDATAMVIDPDEADNEHLCGAAS